jgi:predicted flap endonuclease-1-like 5' DNA nuclease
MTTSAKIQGVHEGWREAASKEVVMKLNNMRAWLRGYCRLEDWLEPGKSRRSNLTGSETSQAAMPQVPGWVWELALLGILIVLLRFWVGRRDRRVATPVEGYELPMPPLRPDGEPTSRPAPTYEAPESLRIKPVIPEPEPSVSESRSVEPRPGPARSVVTPETPPTEPAEIDQQPTIHQPDDLRRIKGIGPKIAALLESAGITTFQKLAESDEDGLRAILKEAGLSMIQPESWPEQARLAAAGDSEGLQALKSKPKAGRRS